MQAVALSLDSLVFNLPISFKRYNYSRNCHVHTLLLLKVVELYFTFNNMIKLQSDQYAWTFRPVITRVGIKRSPIIKKTITKDTAFKVTGSTLNIDY